MFSVAQNLTNSKVFFVIKKDNNQANEVENISGGLNYCICCHVELLKSDANKLCQRRSNVFKRFSLIFKVKEGCFLAFAFLARGKYGLQSSFLNISL